MNSSIREQWKNETNGHQPMTTLQYSEYPHLLAMSTDDLALMLRECSKHPEDTEFVKAIVKEIARRKPPLNLTQ